MKPSRRGESLGLVPKKYHYWKVVLRVREAGEDTFRNFMVYADTSNQAIFEARTRLSINALPILASAEMVGP